MSKQLRPSTYRNNQQQAHLNLPKLLLLSRCRLNQLLLNGHKRNFQAKLTAAELRAAADFDSVAATQQDEVNVNNPSKEEGEEDDP